MNTFAMASVTALYHLHMEEKAAHRLGWQMVPTAVIEHPDGMPTCAILPCHPKSCPILRRYLTEPDEREVKDYRTIPASKIPWHRFTNTTAAPIRWPLY